ncbi:MAG: HRDC domain-containing protein [Nanoarchaeota archaeon]|nr:HRDC domain-containing protein [Nanoarchaeota archaeon]
MEETPEAVIQKKYGINLKRTSKGVWYIDSLSINADTKEEFEQAIIEAKEIASKTLSDVQEMGNRLMLEKSQEFLKDNESSSNIKPKKQRNPVEPIELNQEDQKLFERLKIKRNEIANEKNFPSYLIFNNSTLAYFASKKPQMKEEMLLIHGVGEKKFQDYGEIFLKEIADYCKN